MIAVCCTESYLSETSQHLSDSNFAAVGALGMMDPDQHQGSSSSTAPPVTCTTAVAQHATLYSSTSQHGAMYSSNTPPTMLHSPTSQVGAQTSRSSSRQQHVSPPSSISAHEALSAPILPVAVQPTYPSHYSSCQNLSTRHNSTEPIEPIIQQPLSPHCLGNPKLLMSPKRSNSEQERQSSPPQMFSSPFQPLMSPEPPLSPDEPISPEHLVSPLPQYRAEHEPQIEFNPPPLISPLSSESSNMCLNLLSSPQLPTSPQIMSSPTLQLQFSSQSFTSYELMSDSSHNSGDSMQPDSSPGQPVQHSSPTDSVASQASCTTPRRSTQC